MEMDASSSRYDCSLRIKSTTCSYKNPSLTSARREWMDMNLPRGGGKFDDIAGNNTAPCHAITIQHLELYILWDFIICTYQSHSMYVCVYISL